MTNELNDSVVVDAPAKLLGQGNDKGKYEHFTDSQSKGEGFRNVGSAWTKQCMTFDQGKELLAQDQKKIVDIRGPLTDWQAVVTDNDKFALRHLPSGRDYVPTSNGLKNIAYLGKTSDWFLQDMSSDKTKKKANGDEVDDFKRDREDAELLVHTANVVLFRGDRVDQEKERLFRTWDDGTLRAVLSNQYVIVNNMWYLDLLSKLIPGGLLSHWRGDADTIFGNILIPDTIREEQDSAYGGMLSVGNSEIGLRRILSLPSVFRAICMNGCIWDQEKGKGVSKVHRGEVNFEDLGKMIAQNVQSQIPLLSEGIDLLLGTRAYRFGEATMKQVIATAMKKWSMGRKVAQGLVDSYLTERKILGDDVMTAFGLQAIITRAGQELSPTEWYRYDSIGGEIANMDRKKWEGFCKQASGLDEKETAKVLGDVDFIKVGTPVVETVTAS